LNAAPAVGHKLSRPHMIALSCVGACFVRHRPAARLAECFPGLLCGYVAGKQRRGAAVVDGRRLPDFGGLVGAPLVGRNVSRK